MVRWLIARQLVFTPFVDLIIQGLSLIYFSSVWGRCSTQPTAQRKDQVGTGDPHGGLVLAYYDRRHDDLQHSIPLLHWRPRIPW